MFEARAQIILFLKGIFMSFFYKKIPKLFKDKYLSLGFKYKRDEYVTTLIVYTNYYYYNYRFST